MHIYVYIIFEPTSQATTQGTSTDLYIHSTVIYTVYTVLYLYFSSGQYEGQLNTSDAQSPARNTVVDDFDPNLQLKVQLDAIH